MLPDELRVLANTWRNLAGAAQGPTDYMRTAGLTGCSMYLADLTVQHANTIAQQLEERAAELEKMRDAPVREPHDGD